jgi:membrane protein required for beta-lactamase induction
LLTGTAGYCWGDRRLAAHVHANLERARAEGDDRLEQLAGRFLS